MRVLVVEDEVAAREAAGGGARRRPAMPWTARPTASARIFSGRPSSYDAVVLDLGLPKVDGLTLLRRWRDAGLTMPVLVLTARGSWHEKVHGIDGGADDYVAKPFRMEEVLARLRALIRRSSGQVAGGASLRRDRARSARREGHRRRAAGPPHQPRVPRALVSDAPSRQGRVAVRAERAHLRARTPTATRTRWRSSSRGCGASSAPRRSRPCAASAIAWTCGAGGR